MNKIKFLLLSPLFLNCNSGNEKPMNHPTYSSNISSVETSIVDNGDTLTYNELKITLLDVTTEERINKTLYYAKIMANRYNYAPAYSDYFYALCDKNNINIDNFPYINLSNLNKNDKQIAFFYLDKMLRLHLITAEEYSQIKK